jgi:hypothetical protein
MDDCGQFGEKATEPRDTWKIYSQTERFPHLPAKFNHMASLADPRTDLFVVIEDDDIYFPHHIDLLVESYKSGNHFLATEQIFSTYGKGRTGEVQREKAEGRFHASWGYSKEMWDKVGGYVQTDQLSFDQETRGRFIRESDSYSIQPVEPFGPSYAYRWGNGHWNASGAGSNYSKFYDNLSEYKSEHQSDITPHIDEEAYKVLTGVVDKCWNNIPLV